MTFVYIGLANNDILKIDANTGVEDVGWRFTGHTDKVTGVAVDPDGYVYSSSYDGTVRKIDPDGNEVWKFEKHTSTYIMDVGVDSDGYVYSCDYDGYVIKITPNGREVWSYEANTIVRCLSEMGGIIYIGCGHPTDTTTVRAISGDETVWSFKVSTNNVYSIATGGKYVYAGAAKLYKIDKDGNGIWTFDTNSSMHGVSVSPEAPYVGDNTDRVYKVDDSNGSEIWRFTEHTNAINAVATDTQGNIYSGSYDNYVYKINEDGDEVWSFDCGSDVWALAAGAGTYGAFPEEYEGLFIDYSTNDGTSWTATAYRSWKVVNGIGRNILAPLAEIKGDLDSPISANDLVRIREDTDVFFEGRARSGGKIKIDGSKTYEILGNGYEIMDKQVDISTAAATGAAWVLEEALSGTSYSVIDLGSGIEMTYESTGTVKDTFRDVMDLTGDLILMQHDKSVILYEDGRDNYLSLDTSTDPCNVLEYEGGILDTIINKAIIWYLKTNGNWVWLSESDFNSIDKYGQRIYEDKYKYIKDGVSASILADNIIEGEPLSQIKLLVGGTASTYDYIAGQAASVVDPAKKIETATLTIEEQNIYEGYNELVLGRVKSLANKIYHKVD